MQKEKARFFKSFQLPILFVAILAIIKLFETVTLIDLGSFGVYPRDVRGMLGILTYPLIHGDWLHWFHNSIPLIVLGFLTLYSYRSVAHKVIPFIWIASGVGIWIFARSNFHIGASGVVYGLAFFLAFSGLFRKDIKSVALALFIVFWYGSMIWGVLPLKQGVSWEGHLFGALAGVYAAYRYRNINKVAKKEWNEKPEPLEYNEDPFWVKKEIPVIPEEPLSPPVQNPVDRPNTVNNDLERLKKTIQYTYVPKKKEDDKT